MTNSDLRNNAVLCGKILLFRARARARVRARFSSKGDSLNSYIRDIISSMSKVLGKAYIPQEVEEKWYTFWEKGGYFLPREEGAPYCISIPPPNVTGVLHMGHALTDTLQDVLIRWARMRGLSALWIPGTDHAGIATQTVVERHLWKTEGKRRTDLTREEFLARTWSWKEKSEKQILAQLARLGSSCDWSRCRFTMDEGCSRAVRTLFKKMYDDGLIYRGDYLVNWDPVTQTALADDEVEYEEQESSLWFIRYPLENGKGALLIATTRPETLLGDVAVAVSPKDERYRALIGQTVRLPLLGRSIPIIADPHVDPDFGSGAVKVTPAHDPNDYEMGMRHNLERINILTAQGTINENGGPFAGLSIPEARKAVVEALKAAGLLEKTIPHRHRVGVSYRSRAIIEPYLSKQWFVRLSAFKSELRGAVEKGEVELIPASWQTTYFHWIDNLRDWCISRQLWWGHRIPIWRRKDNPEVVLCYAGEGEPPEVAKESEAWQQDADVLDTWFSSALWPLSILGWPDKSKDFERFYPNATLITGHDILFFWVARMILVGKYLTKRAPFPKVFLHGLIYGKSYWRIDKEGQVRYLSSEERLKYELGQQLPSDIHCKWEKMSKSKGNVIDPLEISATYGTDAMRIALCSSATQAREIDLDRRRFEEFKNFANKVWNGARFVLMHLEDLSPEEVAEGIDLAQCKLEDEWILALLDKTIGEVNGHLESYAFDKAAISAYDFFWKEFCAYYVELTKPALFGKSGTADERKIKQKILVVVLCSALRLLHPLTPFITEELFQQLKARFQVRGTPQDPYTQELLQALEAPACIVAPYPKSTSRTSSSLIEVFAFMQDIVLAIRRLRAEMQLSPATATDIYLSGPSAKRAKEHESILKALLKIGALHFEPPLHALPFSATALVSDLQILIPLPSEMREKERSRLTKEKERLIAQQNGARSRLANADFVAKAPATLVAEVQGTLSSTEKELSAVIHKLEQL